MTALHAQNSTHDELHDSDQQIIERVQQGDKRAFDLLVLKYQHKIISIVTRYVRDRADVQDVVQEVFIKAYRALGGFRGDSAFYTWMYRIAINAAKNHLVSRGRRLPSSDIDVDSEAYYAGCESLHDFDTPETTLFCEQLQAVVELSIENLPEDLRIAVTLREMDGLSYEEIAVIMKCPVGTVRSRIFRAREIIDKVVQPLVG
jgi:RNA polymerase sigma-70 factor, ECF subfamily